MEAASTLILIVIFAYSGGVFGGTVIVRSTAAIKGQQPLRLNCSYAHFYKWTYGYISDIIWTKVEKGVSEPIFHLNSYNSRGEFSNDWKGKGSYTSYPAGISFDGYVTIVLPAHYVTPDLAGTYRCEVKGTKSETNTTNVIIYYGPEDTIRINNNVTALNGVEGDSITIVCQADCSPACTYSWYFGSELINSTNGVLYFDDSDLSQTGKYTCVAGNVVHNRSKEINLNILRDPDRKIWLNPKHSTVTKIEGTRFTVRCRSRCDPPCRSFWYKGSRNLLTDRDVLVLPNITSAEAGNYTCVANNNVTHVTKSLELKVKYGPGSSITFEPANSIQTLLEGQSISVACSAVCNPNCTCSWLKPSGAAVMNRVLSLDHVTQNQSGYYTCYASNGIGFSSSRIILNILFQPRITDLSINRGNNMVAEGDRVIFSCSVTTNPAPRITWSNVETSTVLLQEKSVFTSSFTIDKAGCLDTARYSCVADNGIGRRAKGNIHLYVKCSPRKDIRIPTNSTVFAKLGSKLSFSVHVIAYPPPKFTWYHVVDLDLVLADLPHYRGYDTEASSTLNIASVQMKDFGQYFVNATNDEGKYSMAFYVLRTDGPAVPTDFVCTGHTASSIGLQWVSQDSHGAQQKFSIRYLGEEERQWSTFTEEFNDPGIGKTLEANITELSPNMFYRFQVYGRNKWGYSDFQETTCFTASEIFTARQGRHDLTFPQGVAVGLAIGLVVCLCVVGSVSIYRHGSRRYEAVPVKRGRGNKPLKDSLVNITWNNHGDEALSLKTPNGIEPDGPASPSNINVWQCRKSDNV